MRTFYARVNNVTTAACKWFRPWMAEVSYRRITACKEQTKEPHDKAEEWTDEGGVKCHQYVSVVAVVPLE